MSVVQEREELEMIPRIYLRDLRGVESIISDRFREVEVEKRENRFVFNKEIIC